MSRIRVFIVDDHYVLRVGLRDMLQKEPDVEVVGTASSAAEIRRKAWPPSSRSARASSRGAREEGSGPPARRRRTGIAHSPWVRSGRPRMRLEMMLYWISAEPP